LLLFVIGLSLVLCQNWVQLPSKNAPPNPTALGGMGALNGVLYYYAGVNECSGTGSICSDDPCVNIFFGHVDSYDLITNLWKYNVDSGSLLRPGNISTFGYTSHPQRNLFLVYGSATFQGGAVASCNNVINGGLWGFNPSTGQWTHFDANSPITPGARADASILVHNDEVYLFAGLTSSYQLMNDVWKFNFETATWTLVNSGLVGTVPVGRYHQVTVLGTNCQSNNQFEQQEQEEGCDHNNDFAIMAWGDNYLFGATVPHINDIWEYTFSTNSWRLVETGSKKANYHPIAGIFGKKFFIGGGDFRPRPLKVDLQVQLNGQTVDGQAFISINSVTYVATTQDVDLEYYDPVTQFETSTTDLQYWLDITNYGSNLTQNLMQVYPRNEYGPFKMSAYVQISPTTLAVRGGYGYFCAKFAPRCSIEYLKNVYLIDLSTLGE
jgi:hypothetical protein